MFAVIAITRRCETKPGNAGAQLQPCAYSRSNPPLGSAKKRAGQEVLAPPACPGINHPERRAAVTLLETGSYRFLPPFFALGLAFALVLAFVFGFAIAFLGFDFAFDLALVLGAGLAFDTTVALAFGFGFAFEVAFALVLVFVFADPKPEPM